MSREPEVGDPGIESSAHATSTLRPEEFGFESGAQRAGMFDTLLPMSSQDAPGLYQAHLEQPMQQTLYTESLAPHMDLHHQTALFTATPGHIRQVLEPNSWPLYYDDQSNVDSGFDVPDMSGNLGFSNGTGNVNTEGARLDRWDGWGALHGAQSQRSPAENLGAFLSTDARPLTTVNELSLAPLGSGTAQPNGLTREEVRDVQNQRLMQRRGVRPSTTTVPAAGIQKTKNTMDAVRETRAGRLRACAGCWIQHKKVLTPSLRRDGLTDDLPSVHQAKIQLYA